MYDTLGRMVALTNPDTGRTEWRYDPASNIAVKETARLRANKQLIRYVYDYDRLRQITYPVSLPVVYTYGTPAQSGDANGNVAGRVVSETNESGLRKFTYDHLGNVATEHTEITNQAQPNLGPYKNDIAFTYDSFGRMLTLTYPDTEVVTWGYDHGGNVVSANGHKTTPNPQHPYENPNTAYLTFVGYDEFEQKVRMIQGNGVQTTYAHDPQTRRLTGITSSYRNPQMVQQGQPAQPMQALAYTYDLVGNILTANNNVPFNNQLNSSALPGPVSQTFAYDNLYQLRTASGRYQERSDWHYEYTLAMAYDTIGNVTTKNQQSFRYVPDQNSPGGWRLDHPIINEAYTDTYKYTGPQPHAPTEIDELPANQSQTIPRVFNYDASGNQTGFLYQNSDKRTITWDEEDRASIINENGQNLTQALYDARGNRTNNFSEGQETVYFDQFLTLRNGTFPTKHIFADGAIVADKIDPIWMDNPPTLYYHSDHLGSLQLATNDGQELIQHEEYFPSGELWVDESDSRYQNYLRFLFNGKEFDQATKLYYYGARYYDPHQSQWISADPALAGYLKGNGSAGVRKPATLGVYGYTWNNPVRWVDSQGLLPDDPGHEASQNTLLAMAVYMPELLEAVNASPTLRPRDVQDAAFGGQLSNFSKHPGTTFLGTVAQAIVMENLRNKSTGWLLLVGSCGGARGRDPTGRCQRTTGFVGYRFRV